MFTFDENSNNPSNPSSNGILSVAAGPGIYVSDKMGNVTLANTGVISLKAGPGIAISGVAGNLVVSNTYPSQTNSGTVTSITAGTGLTGGTITASGTINLSNTGVAPGTYANPTITVDAQGRITLAAPGNPTSLMVRAEAPLQVNASLPQTISVANASTSAAGVVQLSSATNSTSETQAATPAAVKLTYDLAQQAETNANNAYNIATAASTAAEHAQHSAQSANLNAAAAISRLNGGVSGTFKFGDYTVVINDGLITYIS